MRLTPPTIEVPGDYTEPDVDTRIRPNIMARSGECVGLDPAQGLAVWRFGWLDHSEHAYAYSSATNESVWLDAPACSDFGFVWVLCTITTATVRETWRGLAADMPDNFRKVLDA